jgi:hypothetical protein
MVQRTRNVRLGAREMRLRRPVGWVGDAGLAGAGHGAEMKTTSPGETLCLARSAGHRARVAHTTCALACRDVAAEWLDFVDDVTKPRRCVEKPAAPAARFTQESGLGAVLAAPGFAASGSLLAQWCSR